jgi:hypothetical protein
MPSTAMPLWRNVVGAADPGSKGVAWPLLVEKRVAKPMPARDSWTGRLTRD